MKTTTPNGLKTRPPSTERRGRATISGFAPSGKAVPAPKGTTKNQGTPLGDFADFLRWRLSKHFGGDRERLVESLKSAGVKAGEETVRKWEQGANGPKLIHLDRIAKGLGYPNWFELAAAIRRFKQR